MAIDSSIPFRALATNVPLLTPQDHQDNALARQMKQLQMQNMQSEMQERQQAAANRNALAEALKGIKPGADGKINYTQAGTSLIAHDPKLGMDFLEKGEQQAETQRKQQEEMKLRMKKALIYADTSEAWDEQISLLEQEGVPGVAEYRGKYSPVARQYFMAQVDPAMLKPDLKQVDLGGKVQWVDVNPFTNPQIRGSHLDKTLTPSDKADLNLGYARLNQDERQFQQSQATQRPALGKAPSGYRYKSDGTLEAIPGGPATTKTNSQAQTQADAGDLLELIDQAETLVSGATGSYAGAGLDAAARFFGKSTPGADKTAQLQALEGAMMAKMPKMSGPQSDKDVALYKQMVGRIGDPTIPSSQKKAALGTIKLIQKKYAGKASAPAAKPQVKFLGFE